jgi:hypothetical protein
LARVPSPTCSQTCCNLLSFFFLFNIITDCLLSSSSYLSIAFVHFHRPRILDPKSQLWGTPFCDREAMIPSHSSSINVSRRTSQHISTGPEHGEANTEKSFSGEWGICAQ